MTERNAMEISERRYEVYQQQSGRCFTCGMPMSFTGFELAHRLPQREWCIKRWGAGVVHASTVGTHPGRCNSGAQLNPDSLTAERLAQTLRRELRREDRKRWAR